MAPEVTQANGRGLSASRTVVPALPLAYLQKRKQILTVREKAKAEIRKEAADASLTKKSPPASPKPLPVQALLPEVAPVVVNGSTGEHTPEEPMQIIRPPLSVVCALPEIEEDVHMAASPALKTSAQGETTGMQFPSVSNF